MIQQLLRCMLWMLDSKSGGHIIILAIMCLFGFLPMVAASSMDCSGFPEIEFGVFAEFIGENFSNKVSLATVLTVLFTMTNNLDLLNLHARQQNSAFVEEQSQQMSGWMKALCRALQEKLGDSSENLLKKKERTADHVATIIGTKLDKLSKLLNLYPYGKDGKRIEKLKEISEKDIEPALVICPPVMECETSTCNPRSLLQNTDNRDIPQVTLIKGSRMYDNVLVLSGRCPKCQTKYYADHESVLQPGDNTWSRYYIKSAKFLKIGQQLWVDRVFSGAVLNGHYSFHASSSALAEFWTDSFWTTQKTTCKKVTRRQMWQAFVQESLRRIAASSGHVLELPDGLSIAEVTRKAFAILGEEGLIRSADKHFCSECTHPFKASADRITNHDPAALLGVDENQVVPALEGDDADLAVQDAAAARFNAQNAMDVDDGDESDDERAPIKLIVIDGQVMGPRHCAYDNCSADLANAQRGVFCVEHEILRGGLCRMRNCQNLKAHGSQACTQHQNRWHSHAVRYGRQTVLGISRIVRRAAEERLPWLPALNEDIQPHDEPGLDAPRRYDNYFKAPRFYCVETITAPCGVVIAWTKFAKSESPTNILNFLSSVYPTPELRPDYICIDKACTVLRTALANGSWNTWKATTRFVVDSYHYINHRTTDYLCRTWCNPAPLNGSQPNLVAVEYDRHGQPHYKRAFNTQVSSSCFLNFHFVLTLEIIYRHLSS